MAMLMLTLLPLGLVDGERAKYFSMDWPTFFSADQLEGWARDQERQSNDRGEDVADDVIGCLVRGAKQDFGIGEGIQKGALVDVMEKAFVDVQYPMGNVGRRCLYGISGFVLNVSEDGKCVVRTRAELLIVHIHRDKLWRFHLLPVQAVAGGVFGASSNIDATVRLQN
jgi:hypothetical protein